MKPWYLGFPLGRETTKSDRKIFIVISVHDSVMRTTGPPQSSITTVRSQIVSRKRQDTIDKILRVQDRDKISRKLIQFYDVTSNCSNPEWAQVLAAAKHGPEPSKTTPQSTGKEEAVCIPAMNFCCTK